MDVCEIGGWVRKIAVKKAARMGVSEGTRNIISYREDTRPGPAMIVNATREKTEEVLDRQYRPLFEFTPRLTRHLRKVTGHTIKLNKTVIDLGWPNSPITMADRSIRDIYGDETNKWPRFAKQEASPAPLLEVRLDTYYDQSLLFLLSSPTHSSGTISIEYDGAPEKVHGEVPCPKCKKYQPYDFWNGVKWDGIDGVEDNRQKAARIQEGGLAYYKCRYCDSKWNDAEKDEIGLKMVYVFDGDRVSEEDIKQEHKDLEERLGRKVDRKYNRIIWKGRRPSYLGVQLSGLFSPWRSYSRFLAEMYKSLGDPGKMQNFRNSWIGEDYEYTAATITESHFTEKVKDGGDRFKVPYWASCIVATADTQQTHFFYTIRAHGPAGRSQLVDEGMVDSFDELRRRTLDSEFIVDREGWGTVMPVKLFIDAGGGAIKGENTTRTWEVYQFALSDPDRIIPVRGHGGAYEMEGSLQIRTIDYTPPGQGDVFEEEKVKITYLRINTGVYKDLLSSRIQKTEEDDDYWGLHNEKDRDYLAQMASEHKVLEGQGKNQKFIWKTKTSGAANHYWDCEVYQIAGAEYLRASSLPTIEGIMIATQENDHFMNQTRNKPKTEERRRW